MTVTSACGPSRHIAPPRELGRFRVEADSQWHARSALSVENDPMYGPAVRCKRFCRAWRQRSCINVSGLWLEHLLRAIMDISAHAVSLADRPQPGHLGHQCSHAPGRPILHHRLILSQTPGRGKGSIISSIASSGLLLFLCSCLAAVPSSRPSQVQRCAARKDRQGWPSRLPCLSHWRGQATP